MMCQLLLLALKTAVVARALLKLLRLSMRVASMDTSPTADCLCKATCSGPMRPDAC